MSDDHTLRALNQVENCNEPSKLRTIADNALKLGNHKVRHAAQLRLYSILPAAKPGTLEHDVWQSVFALEGALKEERGKTTLLARTRQKLERDGERKTVADLVLGKVSDGFRMLVDRDMPRLTFEAVALRHAQEFEDQVIEAAEQRLSGQGYDTAELVA